MILLIYSLISLAFFVTSLYLMKDKVTLNLSTIMVVFLASTVWIHTALAIFLLKEDQDDEL